MNSVVLFSKAPLPGSVKTRLTPPVSPEEAALLQEAFILDTLATLENLEKSDIYIACHPGKQDPFFQKLKKKIDLNLISQGEGDLGDRMKRVMGRLKDKGYEKIIILGSDSPTLPGAVIEEGLARLENCPLVIGPSMDGGYYLLGVSGDIPPVFDGIDWGSDQVFSQTMEKIRALGVGFSILDYWYDVDTVQELRFLAIHLKALPPESCTRTRAIIEGMIHGIECPE